jgi:hypothetical protein
LCPIRATYAAHLILILLDLIILMVSVRSKFDMIRVFSVKSAVENWKQREI